MKKFILIALAVSAAMGGASSADARRGCRYGFHAGPAGKCIAYRPGRFYRKYGYWDGHRFFWHRHRDNGQWRYN